MAQRISRAKQRIKTSGVPFRMPTDEERDERLDAVLHVLYLIFNEGYTSTSGTSLHEAIFERGDSADARRAQAPAARWGSVGPPGADAPDRCQTSCAHGA